MKISVFFSLFFLSPQKKSVSLKLELDVEAFGFIAAANGQFHYFQTAVRVLGGTRLAFRGRKHI